MTKSKMTEAILQEHIVNYLRLNNRLFVFSIPNEGLLLGMGKDRRRFAFINYLKKMGLTSGVPDLCVIKRGGSVCFLEVKKHGGKLSERQKIIHGRFAELNIPVFTVFSLEEAIKIIERWENEAIVVHR